ncbi:hypothetical protein Bca4012_031282 [Brassica carinata]|uniref:(rape) hypothetical protein n=1 Tax=Brassica napus TaxID=3708 RepID=A0A816JIX5_BRANA|nr:unnamed protein product [Brassica napus]
MKTENFKLIQCMHKYLKTSLHLAKYKGRLAHFFLEEPSFSKLWVREDAEKEEWSYQEFHIPFYPYDHVLNVYYCLCGVTDDGEFIYVSISWQDKKIHVSYYDPKRKSNMTIKIERFDDHEDFWLRNGFLDDNNWQVMGIMPNHIENIMSVKNFTCLTSV